VVLVNAKTRRDKPSKADVLAQSQQPRPRRQRRSGPARENALPVVEPRRPGKDLADAQRRMRELEAQQQRLLAQARESKMRVPAQAERPERAEELAPQPTAAISRSLARRAALQAQIDKQIEEYQKRPRKKFIGARAAEDRFAFYEDAWRVKIERIGTLNFPAEARGRVYGNLRLTGHDPRRRHGGVDRARSLLGSQVLDAAAFKIVRMATRSRSSRPTSGANTTRSSSRARGFRPGRQDSGLNDWTLEALGQAAAPRPSLEGFCYTLGTLVLAAIVVQLWFLRQYPLPEQLQSLSTAFMERRPRDERAEDSRATLRYQWVPYERISVHLKRAVVAARRCAFRPRGLRLGGDPEGDAKTRSAEEWWPAPRRSASSSQEPVPLGRALVAAQGAGGGDHLDARAQPCRSAAFSSFYLNVCEWGQGVSAPRRRALPTSA